MKFVRENPHVVADDVQWNLSDLLNDITEGCDRLSGMYLEADLSNLGRFEQKEYRIGEICTIEKGKSPIKKTAPGAYPLVVTAEERATSAEYPFDGEAVCIPLVSSTGHGHASLKRIHYQKGEFAVGNILLFPSFPSLQIEILKTT